MALAQRLLATLTAVIMLTLTLAGATALTQYAGYGTGYGYYQPQLFAAPSYYQNSYSYQGYAYQPRLKQYNAWESRPEGYGLVRNGPPYRSATGFCDNHFFLGHSSSWDRSNRYYSGTTGYPRIAPMRRATTNYCPPRTTYNPNSYWYA